MEARKNSRVNVTKITPKVKETKISNPFGIYRGDETNKEAFLQRMMMATEWLDLKEVLTGMNKKLAKENPDH